MIFKTMPLLRSSRKRTYLEMRNDEIQSLVMLTVYVRKYEYTIKMKMYTDKI